MTLLSRHVPSGCPGATSAYHAQATVKIKVFTLFNLMHFDGYALSLIQVGQSFDRVKYDRGSFDNYPIIHL